MSLYFFNVTIPIAPGINITEVIPQNISICPITDGQQILKALALENIEPGWCLLFLAGNFVIFHILAFSFLGFCKRNK